MAKTETARAGGTPSLSDFDEVARSPRGWLKEFIGSLELNTPKQVPLNKKSTAVMIRNGANAQGLNVQVIAYGDALWACLRGRKGISNASASAPAEPQTEQRARSGGYQRTSMPEPSI